MSKTAISKLAQGIKTVKTAFNKLDQKYPKVSSILNTLIDSSESASTVKKAFNFLARGVETLDSNYRDFGESGIGVKLNQLGIK